MSCWHAGDFRLRTAGRPLIMGILNATPDSFSDGGFAASPPALLQAAAALVEAGADILDLGGESTRPGSQPVPVTTELKRVLSPLREIVRRFPLPVSVDTSKPEVARAAIEAGAAIINDVTGLRDPAMITVVKRTTVGIVIMHMQGSPATMQLAPQYANVVHEVGAALAGQIAQAISNGIGIERIVIDPGIGFGKTHDHNLALLKRLADFRALKCPVMIGTSRKGFLGAITGRSVGERQIASIASALAAAHAGAAILRVHDVAGTCDALNVWEAQIGWSAGSIVAGDDAL